MVLYHRNGIPMNENEYLFAWSIYIAAALGLLLICFHLTAWMQRNLREVLRLSAAVLLFSPTLIEAKQTLLAPSIAIVALDVLKIGDHTSNALWNLKITALCVFILYLFWILLRYFWRSFNGSNLSRASKQQKQRNQRLQELNEPEPPACSLTPSNHRSRRVEPNL